MILKGRNIYKITLIIFFFIGNTAVYSQLEPVSDFPDNKSINNYGTGLRYVMEKAFNTLVGIDVAWANPNSQFGWYIVIGTSF